MKKILILGISAVGKSTFARKISQLLSLPVYYTDTFWWGEHWALQDDAYVEREVTRILDQDEWIIEGWIEPCSKRKIEEADLVIFLDFSPIRVMYQGILRWICYHSKKRPELPEGCFEQLSWKKMKMYLKREERQEIVDALSRTTPKRLYRCTSRKQAQALLYELRSGRENEV